LRPAPVAPPPDPRRFDEAVDFFRNRVPMPKAEWLKLGTAARQRGFTVADVAQLDVIHQVWLALDDAIARGSTFEDFKATVSETLADEWLGSVANPPARVETIFRTNVMTANNAGRHAQMTDPVVRDRRPYWQYVDIDDQRECPICNACHGTILPADDAWWGSHYPPLHFPVAAVRAHSRQPKRNPWASRSHRRQTQRMTASVPRRPRMNRSCPT
jgi:SPP1 gp7 family putative phage head morphogenesis protein